MLGQLLVWAGVLLLVGFSAGVAVMGTWAIWRDRGE